MDQPRWSFTYDGAMWVPHREPPADENTLRAVETMVLPRGSDARRVRELIDTWKELCERNGVGYSATVTSASLTWVSEDQVEIGDMYGQFQNIIVGFDELEQIWLALAEAIEQRQS